MATKNKNLHILCAILCLHCFNLVNCATYNIVYQTVDDCKKGDTDTTHEYFDISQLSCRPCAQDATYQTVDADGYKCVCRNGFRLVESFGGVNIRCEPCPAGMATSSNGWQCVGCDNGLDPVLNVCIPCQSDSVDGQAQDSRIAVERLLNGTWSSGTPSRSCASCDVRTAPNNAGTQCERCSQVLSVLPGQTDCVCPAENQAGGLCFRSSTDIVEANQQLFRVDFDGDTFDSAYFAETIQAAAGMCQPPYSRRDSCVVLANLCALTVYNQRYTDSLTPDACALYTKIADLHGVRGRATECPSNMPCLYFPASESENVVEDDTLPTEYRFPESTLALRAARYGVNGTFLGYVTVNNGLLQLCPDSEARLNAAYRVGTFYKQECEITLRRFWDEDDYPLYFYDLYLEYEDGTNTELYPVPILIRNLYPDDVVKDWQLVRRLFLVDNVSGRRFTTAAPPDPDTPGGPVVTETVYPVRYARTMVLRVTVQDGAPGKLYPPVLEVTYGVADSDKYEAGDTDKISFEVVYRQSQEGPIDNIKIAVGVLGALAAIYSGLQTWGWSRRSGRLGIDFIVIVKFVVFSMGNLANVFFVVMLGYSLWWVIFYKRQTTVEAIVPNSDQETWFVGFLAAAFALKFFQLLHLIVVQVTVDIFFIDWERPRGKVTTSNDAGQQNGREAPVSIWRTYFAANEWNEIQTTRKLNHMVQLFSTVFFLSVVGFGNLASKDPHSRFGRNDDVYYAQDSRIFRFGILGLTYIIIAVAQWLFVTFIYERFIEHKIRQYVDLCSMCNISVFILETGQFGYYIHGRSAHGRADTGMREMAENLKREEENLCGQRGLLPNTDKQTFQIAVPAGLRQQYDRVVGPIYNPQAVSGGARGAPGGGLAGAALDHHTDRCLQAYSVLNRFLQAYIDHSVRDIDYIVKDKTFMENVLNMEFTDPLTQGFFYNDSGHSFDSVLLYGHENTLIIFEVLFFAIVDLLAQNYVLAAILVYVLMELIDTIRDGIGRSNLAKKTLVDKRFLI